MNQLVVQGLAKRFGRLHLFGNLSFSIKPGMLVAITGANGSGKSTLLRILAGVLHASAGKVTLSCQGQTVPREKRPLHTGFVAPYLNVYNAFSARENLAFQARTRGLGPQEAPIERVLAQVGLENRANDMVSTFSSGMYQRLRLATALLTTPALLLLDEPFSNLDEAGRQVVDTMIQEQRGQGVLQVMATNVAEYAQRCDKIISIEDYR